MIICTNTSMPVYKGSSIMQNDDGTYCVEHIFDNKGRRVTVKYPRVKIKMDSDIHIRQFSYPDLDSDIGRMIHTNCIDVFPFVYCEALPAPDDNGEMILFGIVEETA